MDSRFVDDVRLRTRLVDLIAASVDLKRRGREHVGLCPLHGERTPSFTVNEDKGFYHCFGCGAHGDAFDWMRAQHGLTFVEAVEELAIRAGLKPDREGRKPLRAAPKVVRRSTDDQSRDKAELIAAARRLFGEAVPASGTLVETYLRSRGVFVPPPVSVRFHGQVYNQETGHRLPAMVAAVQDASSRIVGVHRTWLRPDGQGKAELAASKKMMGVCWAGAIRLCPAAPYMGLAEGIETALSVMAATGLSVWAAGSLGNFAAADLPRGVRDVVICVDNDSTSDRARKAKAQIMDKAVAFHRAKARSVSIAMAAEGMDFNDMIRGAA